MPLGCPAFGPQQWHKVRAAGCDRAMSHCVTLPLSQCVSVSVCSCAIGVSCFGPQQWHQVRPANRALWARLDAGHQLQRLRSDHLCLSAVFQSICHVPSFNMMSLNTDELEA